MKIQNLDFELSLHFSNNLHISLSLPFSTLLFHFLQFLSNSFLANYILIPVVLPDYRLSCLLPLPADEFSVKLLLCLILDKHLPPTGGGGGREKVKGGREEFRKICREERKGGRKEEKEG